MRARSVIALSLFMACAVAGAIFFMAPQTPALKAHSVGDWAEFAHYMVEYQKEYSDEWEVMKRFGIYLANKHEAEAHNAKKLNWTMGINQFSDMTIKEASEMYLSPRPEYDEERPDSASEEEELEGGIDWVQKGAVSRVKDQGSCGSCWTFSSCGALEGAYFLKSGKLVDCAEQQLVDCAGSYGNSGCNGGLEWYAYGYWLKYGVMLERDYPYQAKDQSCKYNSGKVQVKVTARSWVPRGESGLANALNSRPVAVGVDAGQWFRYKGGIFDAYCGSGINHGVTGVGYGTEAGRGYFKIKNSWGSGWGEQGYIRLVRKGGDGQCAVAAECNYPTV